MWTSMARSVDARSCRGCVPATAAARRPVRARRPWRGGSRTRPGCTPRLRRRSATSCRTGSTVMPPRVVRGTPRSTRAQAAPQHGADAGHQLPGAVRLGHVVVGAQVEAQQQIVLGGAGGEHQDRYVRRPGAAPGRRRSRRAPGSIRSRIDEVRPERAGRVESGPSVVDDGGGVTFRERGAGVSVRPACSSSSATSTCAHTQVTLGVPRRRQHGERPPCGPSHTLTTS